MSDNDASFVFWVPGVLTRFGKILEELRIRHIRSQLNSPWTNGKVERLWGTLQAEVLDRQIFRALEQAEAALAAYAAYYNYHRLHGEIGWLTPAERYDGTPFTDRGFKHIPALEHLQGWLNELHAAA
jgi:putative transposase